MNDMQKEFLEILADVRAHLEYQRALGVRTIELPQGETAAPRIRPVLPTRPSAVPAPARTAAAAPSLPRKGEDAPKQAHPSPVIPSPPIAETPAGQPLTLEAVREELGDCTRCKLHKSRKNIVFGEGNPKTTIAFVGEGPGFEEDQQGRPFVGEAGELLTKIIESGMGIKRADVYICNIVKCRPPGNRNPEPDEVAACIGFVKKQIAAINPKVIVTLGNVPTQNLLGTKQGITKLRGTWQSYGGIPVMPTFHPAYLLRSPGEKKKVWEDIQKVMGRLGIAVPAKE